MPDLDTSEFVEITHFINPHVFWLRKRNIVDHEFAAIESEMQQYALRQHEKLVLTRRRNQIDRGARVAVYFVAWKKWLRCDVDVIDAKCERCILWAIDYGFPLQSSIELMVLIENHRLAQKCSDRIMKVAISSVVPWKGVNLGLRARRERWTSAAVDVLSQIKAEHVQCQFTVESVQPGQITLGDLLIITSNGQMKMVSDILIEMHLAKKTTDVNQLLKSLEKTARTGRWICNAGEVHSDCISNEGTLEICSAHVPKAVTPDTWQQTSAPAIAHRVDDGGSEKSSCSADDVFKFFKAKQRNTKLARTQSKTNEDEWISHQKMLNISSIKDKCESKAKTPNVVTPLAYRSFVKRENVCEKRASPEVPPTAWTCSVIGENIQQHDPGMQRRAKIVADEPKVNDKGDSKRIRISGEENPMMQQQSKTDLRLTGEMKIQTAIDWTRILVHNEGLRIRPVTSIREVNFTQEIHGYMKNRETYKSQAYAWPHLMRGNSLILVDSKYTGKTFAYLPALCSRLRMSCDGESSTSPLTMGPKAIILCANASTVESIAGLCRLLMNRIETEVVQAIGARDIRDVAANLFNGCSIFVTTAPCLLNLMKSHADVFSAQMLSFFVFDNVDMIISRYGEEQLVTIFRKFCKRREDSDDMTQVVVTARTWHPALKRMRERMREPLLLIGNFLEAALYGNMHIQVQCTFEAKKMDLVQEHIKSLPIITERLLIICNDSTEAKDLSTMLAAQELPHKCVVSIDVHFKSRVTSSIDHFWRNKNGILICTDETLKDLKILDAQHVIHYSMPKRFYDFLFRLSSCIECYPNDNAKSEKTGGRTSSLFLVDEKNNKQLPKLINLLERKGQTFTDDVLEICQKIRLQNDNEKAEKCRLESICNFLFMHGRSNHESECRDRHLLMPDDVPLPASDVPQSGLIRLKILNIFSPTRYSVQLMSVKQDGNRSRKPINQSNAFMDFNEKFNAYYSDPNNRRDLWTMEMGNFCVIEGNDVPSLAYHRGRIIKIHEKKSRCADDFDVDVRLIDVGTIVRRKSAELGQMADEFCQFPEQAIDLHLIGLVPADSEDEWDSEITQRLKSHLNITLGEDDTHVEANIVISLRKAIVVDLLRIVQTKGFDLPVLTSVKEYMFQLSLGIGAKEVRKDIIKMAETIGIEMTSQNSKQNEVKVTSNACKADSCNLSDVPMKSNNLAAASTPKSADQRSVNLMEFSPMTSKTSSSQNISAHSLPEGSLTPTEAPNGKWITLSSSSFVACDITLYVSPNDFYIYLQSDEIAHLLSDIDKYVEQYDGLDTSMETPDIGNNCLAKVDGKFNRAKILSNSCENGIFYAKVFCCDLGEIVNCEIENIMSIPDWLVNALPFQAIWCRLYGVESNESTDGGWPTKTSLKIYDDIIDPIRNLTAKMISVHSSDPMIGASPFEMQKINVLLMSDESSVNRIIVDKGWAAFKGDAERIIDASSKSPKKSSEIDSDDAEDEECEDEEWAKAGIVRQLPVRQPVQTDIDIQAMIDGTMDFEFDFDEINEFLGELGQKLLEVPRAIEAELRNSDSVEKKEMQKMLRPDSTSNSDNCEDVSFKQQTINTLQSKYRVPYVTWQQSDELIVLRIQADDNVAYNLDVTSNRLVFNAEIQEQTNLLVLYFFGSIDAEHTSHEVRGLNVIVRLAKTSVDWAWPQLTAENVKFHWLSYDYNAIQTDDIYLDKGDSGDIERDVEDIDSDDDVSDSDEFEED